MIYRLRPYQEECVKSISDYINSDRSDPAIVVGPVGCHAKDSLIPMFDATFKKVQDINIGDIIIGGDGHPRTVVNLVNGIDEMYRITPIKGKPFVVNGHHILSLYRTPDGKGWSRSCAGIDEISVNDYILSSKNFKNNHKLRRPGEIYFNGKDNLPLPPYFLGIYLGDGCSTSSIGITTRWQEVVDYLYEFAKKYDLHIRVATKNKGDNKAKSYFLTTGKCKGQIKSRNKIINIIKEIGLFGKTAKDKFIPTEYLRSSFENRLELLAGFVDTDTYYNSKGNMYEYSSKSYRMISQVQFLCKSLGLGAEIGKPKIVNGETYYRMQIIGNLDIVPNKVICRKGLPRSAKKRINVTGFNIEHIGKGEYYGFTVNGDHLYCDDQFFIHHNCGKSILIAEAARLMGDKTLILQPSKELLQQNHDKITSYGIPATIYSASCGKKELSNMIYATLGSIKKVVGQLKEMGIRNVLIDEAHAGYSPEDGSEFMTFMNELKPRKVIGFTATPCRLKNMSIGQTSYSQLNFITRMRPVYFKNLIHVIQVEEMIRQGFWTPLKYETWDFNGDALKLNSNGSEYTAESISEAVRKNGLNNLILRRLMVLKDVCRSILVFMDSVESCNTASEWMNAKICAGIAEVVHGGTPKKQREAIVERFKSGKTKVVFNYSALGTGFDHPGLDCVIVGRPTFSFSSFYQWLGRAVRIKDGKDSALVVDCCNNSSRFGDIRELSIENYKGYGWGMFIGDKLITNIPMGDKVTKTDLDIKAAKKDRRRGLAQGVTAAPVPGRPDHPLGSTLMAFGKYCGWMLHSIPVSYFKFINETFDWDNGRNKEIKEYIDFLIKNNRL